MNISDPSSASQSQCSTPNAATNRFTSQSSTAEDLLKSQTVGLVHLSDFRKRRAEALEQKEREAQDRSLGRVSVAGTSGSVTPSDGASTPPPPKKKRRPVAKGKLSFGLDEEDDGDSEASAVAIPTPSTPEELRSVTASPVPSADVNLIKKRLGPNTSLNVVPKAKTKSALIREAQTREQLRREFLLLQEAVKNTEILVPFVFYDGTHIPGGVCKVKKGDYIWLFLDKSRKVGAELGVGGAGERASSRREWARVGVDDLMLIRGEVIIPHHFDFYYFIVNKTKGPRGTPLFDYSSQPPSSAPFTADPTHDPPNYDPLARTSKKASGPSTPLDTSLEGLGSDPNQTKVVDRRWYERNKHIFPASVWEEFDPEKDYSKAVRKDTGGNAFFFS
ncbi:MAG: hypothetical protein M1835_002683 [Candelina submexicana]|nr:MAG: hypothetical protein M1835_002683 [Candelina submexicana]